MSDHDSDRDDSASFEGTRLLHEHTIPAMQRAIANNSTQIFSPKEMRELLRHLSAP